MIVSSYLLPVRGVLLSRTKLRSLQPRGPGSVDQQRCFPSHPVAVESAGDLRSDVPGPGEAGCCLRGGTPTGRRHRAGRVRPHLQPPSQDQYPGRDRTVLPRQRSQHRTQRRSSCSEASGRPSRRRRRCPRRGNGIRCRGSMRSSTRCSTSPALRSTPRRRSRISNPTGQTRSQLSPARRVSPNRSSVG
jgi:hypothetical protein